MYYREHLQSLTPQCSPFMENKLYYFQKLMFESTVQRSVPCIREYTRVFLYSLKTSENLRFFILSRGRERKRPVCSRIQSTYRYILVR